MILIHNFLIYFGDRSRRRLDALKGEALALNKSFLMQRERGPGKDLTAMKRFRKQRTRLTLRYTEVAREAGAWDIPV